MNDKLGLWPRDPRAPEPLQQPPELHVLPDYLYIMSKGDVDAVLEGRDITPEQREQCYLAVRDMDSSAIFEQIEFLCDDVLTPESDAVRRLRIRGES
jgi:hypothetical protein